MVGTGKSLFGYLSRFSTFTVRQNHLIDPLTACHTMSFNHPNVSRELHYHEPATSMTAIECWRLTLTRFCRHCSFHTLSFCECIRGSRRQKDSFFLASSCKMMPCVTSLTPGAASSHRMLQCPPARPAGYASG